MPKNVFSYDPATGEYLGEVEADESPLEPGVYLLPAHSTEAVPPPAGAHETQVFRDGAWALVPDWRGHVYWLADRTRHEITELDVAPPVDALDEEPPLPLADLMADKRAELDAACREQIYAGFDCDALGATYHYPANDKDQSNLAGSVIDSMLTSDPEYATPFWCADSNGVWAFRMHTAGQIQAVGQMAKAAILAALSHNEALQTLVSAAEDETDLDEIAW